MSDIQVMAVRYIQQLPESKLNSAIDYLRYLCEQDYPLDDFDYTLARNADNDKSTETITFDVLLQDLGIGYEELQTN
ncbi:MAG: hypothetical protein FWC16_04010 [Defluviitaleaceae bacterium]|nr:hypothetical protein [Defluviitaleaceae bacterium]MCL2274029.1 hypothetical protein [Defluviitaleaceae bacterium]MCL2274070.1 hypothetical protein [Defluviitaleaceae bacterium]